MILAVLLFGREVSTNVVAVAGVVIVVLALMILRHGPHPVNDSGHGRMFSCARCGHQFQPDRVEQLDNGGTYEYSDDSCPNCGLRLRDRRSLQRAHHHV